MISSELIEGERCSCMVENMLKWLIGIFYIGITMGVAILVVGGLPDIIERFITMLLGRKKPNLKKKRSSAGCQMTRK